MSSRQLRKLQQQRELEEQQRKLQAEKEQEEESDEEPQQVRPKPSLFANLAALGDIEGDEPGDSDKEELSEGEELSKPTPAPASISKKPKKPKKKKKAKNKGKGDGKEATATGKDELDEIDEALEQLNLKQSIESEQPGIAPKNDGFERVCKLLGVNTQHLKVANEMRSLFGRAAIENHEDAGGPVGRAPRHRQRMQQMDLETALKGHHQPGKGLPELTLRRNFLVQGKEEWPKAGSGGLTMAVVDDQAAFDGTIEYRFVHDQTYQEMQQSFYGYVELGNPHDLIGLLIRNPYHVSLLLQVSKIAKDQGDHSLSSDLVERALFTFGRIALSSFGTKLSQGKARLDFARPENRELWLAGYHYIKSLIMKGTYKTALEWAKLLFSLDPEEDPYCMRWMIHHLALRAHEYQWLLDFGDSPGMLAWDATEDYALPSFALAALQLKDGARCRSVLQRSLEQAPWLYCRLFKELDLEAPPSIWGQEPRTDAETLFTELYVLQAKDLWNIPEATALLMEVAHAVDKIDAAKIPLLRNGAMSLNIVRFVYLDNRPALMGLAPSHLLHRNNNSDSDPLPPDSNLISYPAQQRSLNNEGGLPDGFDDPIAALARLIPNFLGLEALRNGPPWVNRNNEDIEDLEQLGDDLTGTIDVENSDDDDGEGGEDGPPRIPISLNRLMFWRSPAYADQSDSNTDTEAEDDEPMPELEPLDTSRRLEPNNRRNQGGEEEDPDMPTLE